MIFSPSPSKSKQVSVSTYFNLQTGFDGWCRRFWGVLFVNWLHGVKFAKQPFSPRPKGDRFRCWIYCSRGLPHAAVVLTHLKALSTTFTDAGNAT